MLWLYPKIFYRIKGKIDHRRDDNMTVTIDHSDRDTNNNKTSVRVTKFIKQLEATVSKFFAKEGAKVIQENLKIYQLSKSGISEVSNDGSAAALGSMRSNSACSNAKRQWNSISDKFYQDCLGAHAKVAARANAYLEGYCSTEEFKSLDDIVKWKESVFYEKKA